jgi:hypothetical protein
MKESQPGGGSPDAKQRKAVTRLAVVYVMLLLAQQCMPNTIVLYTDYRFGWSVQQIGVYLTGVGVAGMMVQALVSSGWGWWSARPGVLVPKFQRCQAIFPPEPAREVARIGKSATLGYLPDLDPCEVGIAQ